MINIYSIFGSSKNIEIELVNSKHLILNISHFIPSFLVKVFCAIKNFYIGFNICSNFIKSFNTFQDYVHFILVRIVSKKICMCLLLLKSFFIFFLTKALNIGPFHTFHKKQFIFCHRWPETLQFFNNQRN